MAKKRSVGDVCTLCDVAYGDCLVAFFEGEIDQRVRQEFLCALHPLVLQLHVWLAPSWECVNALADQPARLELQEPLARMPLPHCTTRVSVHPLTTFLPQLHPKQCALADPLSA